MPSCPAPARPRSNRVLSGAAPKKLAGTIRALKKEISEKQPKVATRKSSEMVLEVVNPIMPETIGGSADLTGSNNTLTKDLGIFDPENRKGRYIHYGIREHGMAAAMNGMALHGGIRPYGGTFLCFTDYARGAMRLSSLMGVPVDLCDDARLASAWARTARPTSRSSIWRCCAPRPTCNVFRPADTVETAEAWEIALTSDRDAVGAGADAPGPAHRAHRAQGEEPDRPGRLCAAPRPRASGRRS